MAHVCRDGQCFCGIRTVGGMRGGVPRGVQIEV